MAIDEYPEVGDLIQSATCQFCAAQFSNASARRLHEIKRHDMVYTDSDERLRNPKGLADKDQAASRVPSRHFCPFADCDKFYSSKKLLTQHYQKTHSEKREECEMCGHRFALKRDRVYHEKMRCPSRPRGSADLAKRSKSSKNKATLINCGTAAVVVVNAESSEELVRRIVESVSKIRETTSDGSGGKQETQDGCTQTEEPQPLIMQAPMLVDSMSQSIQTMSYDVTLETRHAETSIDTVLDDFRHIETQTLPLWDQPLVDLRYYM